MAANFRLPVAESSEKREQIAFTFNGQQVMGYEGEPVAVALWACGIKTIRSCGATAQPRGVYCGIGHCYECRAQVDGVANVRTCMTPLSRGTSVSSSSDWHIEGA